MIPLQGTWFVKRMIDVHGIERVNEEYNGIGAEWMGARVRGFLTRIFPEFEPAAYIHDVRVGFSSEIGSHESNRELLRNCRLLALCSERPFRLKIAAYVFYFACEVFGKRY